MEQLSRVRPESGATKRVYSTIVSVVLLYASSVWTLHDFDATENARIIWQKYICVSRIITVSQNHDTNFQLIFSSSYYKSLIILIIAWYAESLKRQHLAWIRSTSHYTLYRILDFFDYTDTSYLDPDESLSFSDRRVVAYGVQWLNKARLRTQKHQWKITCTVSTITDYALFEMWKNKKHRRISFYGVLFTDCRE